MQKIEAVVRAYPETNGWIVECSDCGPLAFVFGDDTDKVCAEHLIEHGAEIVTR